MEVADIPEAVAEAAAPAVKEGPLPFNYVANQDEGDGESWTLLGYSLATTCADVLHEGTKPEMVEALILRYAPKRQRKRSREEAEDE